jgi:hypothetical protein
VTHSDQNRRKDPSERQERIEESEHHTLTYFDQILDPKGFKASIQSKTVRLKLNLKFAITILIIIPYQRAIVKGGDTLGHIESGPLAAN